MFFFTAKDGTLLYMGKDKYENEDLIKYGWPEDCWFHVDALSSAHVYCRLQPGQTMDDMSEDLIRDAAQLVKENSIEGCKKASVTVIYTPWANLRKDGSMAVGQVAFHSDRNVRKYVVMEKDKETLRRLAKTKDERYPDLCKQRAERDAEELKRLKAEGKARFKARQEEEEAKKREYAAYSYDTLFKPEAAGGGAQSGGRGRGGGRGGRGGRGGKERAAGGGPSVFEEGAGAHFGADDEADLMGLGGGAAEATGDATAAKAFEESFM